MTDALEERLRQAATAAGLSSRPPVLVGLRQRARRRRAAQVGAPLAVAAVLLAGVGIGVVNLQPQQPDRVTTPAASAGAEDLTVTFQISSPNGALPYALESPLPACLELPGVEQRPILPLGYPSALPVRVTGADNIAAFDQCVRRIPRLLIDRSDQPRETNAAARQRWGASGRPDYTYRLREQCFCPAADYRVTVVDGDAVGIEQISGEDQRTPTRLQLSIDDLFDLIDRRAGVASIRAEYDDRYGYPTTIDVDRDANAIDDEYTLLISEYQPTKQVDTAPPSTEPAPTPTTFGAPTTSPSPAPSPASSPAAPSPAPSGPRETVVNDTDVVITLYCSDCPRAGFVIEPSERVSFVRVRSNYVRFERPDGTATCIGYGSTTGSDDKAARKNNELYVSQGGSCPADYGRPT